MKPVIRALGLVLGSWAILGATALAESITVPKGTEIVLVFDQPLDSGHVKEGQAIRLHVRDAVHVGDVTILGAGSPVMGVVSKVDHRKRFGVNAKLYIALNPVTTTFGQPLALQARSEGKIIGGKRGGEAAAATAGGAVLAGPIGLVGGYFVHGKPVKIKVGDTLLTGTSEDVVLSRA